MQKYSYVLGIDLGDEQARAAWIHHGEVIDLAFGFGQALPYGSLAQKEKLETGQSAANPPAKQKGFKLGQSFTAVAQTVLGGNDARLTWDPMPARRKHVKLADLIAPDPFQSADPTASLNSGRSILARVLHSILSVYVQSVEQEHVIMWGTPDADEIGAVLTAPPDFSLAALEELRKACDEVGFTAIRFVSRPVAAMAGVAHELGFESDRLALLLLLDENGFTQCLLQWEEKAWPASRAVLCKQSPLGSRDLDAPLHDWLVSLIEEDTGRPASVLERDHSDFLAKLRMARTGLLQSRQISLAELLPGYNLELSLTDEEIRDFCDPPLTRIQAAASAFADELKKHALEPARILLVAEPEYVAPLRQKLGPIFAGWPEIESWPLEVMARGAAWLASHYES